MIMIESSPGANISDYGNYISNCTRNQMPYKVPVNSLADVQLYINIGPTEPDSVQYHLIHTCGPLGGATETLSTSDYVIGQDTNDNYYGVFKNLASSNPKTFVIAITLSFGLTDVIYFSEEYSVENSCNPLTLLKGCYGNLDNKLSYDCEGVYFGTPLGDGAMGDLSIVYKHEILLRRVEVYKSAIKNTFKQGRTRNFRTEKEKIFQFNAEFVPEWFMEEIDAVFYRGEVWVGSTKYLVNETAFELIAECEKTWKPTATFKESCYQSFSCEADPCAAPVPDPCCDPSSVSADAVPITELPCCDPEVISADVTEDSGDTFWIENEDPVEFHLVDAGGDHVTFLH